MISANDPTLRVIVDGLISRAEIRPRRSDSARLLRDAAAALLDADMAVQREDAPFSAANDATQKTHGDAA